MKILILSHTRCGSTTLCKWLADELNFKLDETPYNSLSFKNIFELNNIIRKIVVEEYFPTKKDISSFDKVICLFRDSGIDAAISFIIANKTNVWHDKYSVTQDWIDENKHQIEKRALIYDYYKSKLKNYNVFNTTYENIFLNKKDINPILEYLNIKNPKHLYHLDNGGKYRKDSNIFKKIEASKLI